MDYKYIEQLLDRYFAAETTVQEEQILKAFFAQGEDSVPEAFRQYRPLFAALCDEEELDEAFDERLLALVDEQPVVRARRIRLADRLRPLFRAAAIVAIVLTLSNALNRSFQGEQTAPAATDGGYAEYVSPTAESAMAYEQTMTSVAVQATDSLLTDSLSLQ